MADFAQYYQINLLRYDLDGEPDGEDLAWLAILLSQLPRESRVARKESPALEWDSETWLLWQIEYELRCLSWGMADKRHRGPQPKPLPNPQGMADAEAMAESTLRNAQMVDDALAQFMPPQSEPEPAQDN